MSYFSKKALWIYSETTHIKLWISLITKKKKETTCLFIKNGIMGKYYHMSFSFEYVQYTQSRQN